MAVMVDRTIQEARRQKSGSTAGGKSGSTAGGKSGSTAGAKSGSTAGEKSTANSRQHALKLGEVATTIPTVDFNVETVEYKHLSFTVQKDTKMIH